MARPGVNIAISTTPPVTTPPVDTGVWFVTGLAEKGSTSGVPERITSMAEYERYLGSRVSYGQLYDALDIFFREGGNSAYVARVVGPAATSAFAVLNDSVPAATLRVEAKNAGEWGNSLNIQVIAGGTAGTFILIVSHDTLGELERSPELVDKQAAFDWAANSDYIKLVDQASLNDPAVVAATSLSGGLDDRVNITETHWTNALVRFTRDLGPGQVSAPGRTTTAAHTALLSHAGSNNRVGILDPTDTNVKATIQAILDAQRGSNAKWGGLFGRWLKSPGAVPGTTRIIPPSALVAGLIAYADAIGGSPNTPAAGENGVARYITGFSGDPLVDADRESLNAQGYNSIITKYQTIRVYGWRSMAHPDSDKAWINFANSRLVMEIAAKADVLGESFLFDEIDGQGRKISEFGASLTAMLMPYWEIGSLYGVTPTDAFVVDVGPSVNTPTSIANLELKAKIQIRPSPFAEMITIHIVKTSISEPVA